MTKKYQICHHHIRFFQAQNAPKSVAGALPRTPLGELTTLPRPPSGLERGIHPSPFSSPLDAFVVSFLRSPKHKILATPVSSTSDEARPRDTKIKNRLSSALSAV